MLIIPLHLFCCDFLVLVPYSFLHWGCCFFNMNFKVLPRNNQQRAAVHQGAKGIVLEPEPEQYILDKNTAWALGPWHQWTRGT